MAEQATVERIQEIVLEVVCGIQEQSGRPLPETICDTLRPIGDFEGFDSINAVEVTVQLTERLGCEIDGNAFADGRRALKIGEVAKRLHKVVNNNKGAKTK
jgi:acyl carrier protein